MAWEWPMEDFWSSFSRAALSMAPLLRLIAGASLEARWIEVRGVFKGVVAVEAVMFLEEEVPEILKKVMVGSVCMYVREVCSGCRRISRVSGTGVCCFSCLIAG